MCIFQQPRTQAIIDVSAGEVRASMLPEAAVKAAGRLGYRYDADKAGNRHHDQLIHAEFLRMKACGISLLMAGVFRFPRRQACRGGRS